MNTNSTEKLFYPYVSHSRIGLIESRYLNTYNHLSKLLTSHSSVYDYVSIANALPNKNHYVLTLDLLEESYFPIVAIFPGMQVIRNNFLIYSTKLSKHSRGWVKGLTQQECIDACSNIDYVDIYGRSMGSEVIVKNLRILENKS